MLNGLLPQIEKADGLELVIHSHDCKTLGETRQSMIEQAKGEYVSFVDDDDVVSPRYVDAIYPLLDGVDYIGFHVETYGNGKPMGRAYHSLRYGAWYTNNDGFYRDISHLNPIKRKLAARGQFVGQSGEDCHWADSMRSLGIVKTEHYIPEVMYYYYYRPNKNSSDYPGMYGEHS